VVGTVASTALALKFGNDVRQINKELDPYRRFNCSATSCTDINGNPAPPIAPGSKDAQFVSQKTDEGHTAQVLQWVFIGLDFPFAIAGGWLLYKGYLDSESGGGARTSSNHGLRIFPTANASARGIIAEFDF